MGNMGGIERLMVFGILLIIITILAIAFFSANDIEGEFEANNEAEPETSSVFDDDVEGMADAYGRGAMENPETEDNPAVDLGSTPLRNDVNVGMGERGFQETLDDEVPVVDESAQPEPVQQKKYTIQKGDSFAKIARKVLGDEKYTKVLVNANPQCDPLSLSVGDEIVVPDITDARKAATGNSESKKPIKTEIDPNVYIVQKSDTLIKIAEKLYGNKLDWKKLYDANRDILDDPNTLVPGTEIRIPQ